MFFKPSNQLMHQSSQKEELSSETILYIIIVILMALLALAGGYIYYGSGNHPTPTNNNTTNNNLNQTPNLTNTTNSSNSGAIISETDAINIALQYATVHEGLIKFPVSVTHTPNPVVLENYGSDPNQLEYVITVINADTNQLLGYVDVNAYTGQVINYYQNK
jgi:hypothetical protein